jgi:hypothetical protein
MFANFALSSYSRPESRLNKIQPVHDPPLAGNIGAGALNNIAMQGAIVEKSRLVDKCDTSIAMYIKVINLAG